MKTFLKAGTAIALVSMAAAPAGAAEWNVRVGGYMEQFVAYAGSDTPTGSDEYDGIDAKQDAEIFFLPSITLDNGIRIGANIQLEGNTSGDQIDESYLFIQGAFGEVNLGSENSARYKMHYGAPDVTFLNVNSGSTNAFIPFSGTAGGLTTGADIFRGTLGSTYIENGRNNDAQRITYYTPRLAGVQLGMSYARDGNQDSNAQINCNNVTCDFLDFGINYVNNFGWVDVAVSGGWGIAFNDAPGGKDPEVYNFGVNLAHPIYGGTLSYGLSFAEQNDAGAQDGNAFDVGIAYETGPWGFSFTYFEGTNVDNENAALGADEQLHQYLLGVNYKLAKGVDLSAFGAYVDFDEKRGDPVGGTPGGDDVDGFIIGTGIKISF